MVLKNNNRSAILVKGNDFCSGIEVSYYQDDDDGFREYFMRPVIYTYDRAQNLDIFTKIINRINAAWYILRHGQYKSEEITMDQDTFGELITEMVEMENSQQVNE